MGFDCCGLPQKSEGYYYIDHPKKGTTKVSYAAECVRCGNPILKLDAGLFGGNAENPYLRGKHARRFLKEFPAPVLSLNFRQKKKNTAKNIHYFDFEGFERQLATGYKTGKRHNLELLTG